MITTEIASEKGSRAMEMLLVSVKPATHFKAKIAGVLLLALTQMGIIAVVFLIYANREKRCDLGNGDKHCEGAMRFWLCVICDAIFSINNYFIFNSRCIIQLVVVENHKRKQVKY
ncbi:hypothetical protein LSPH24S_07763 [Lysinibacillus sphaericus]